MRNLNTNHSVVFKRNFSCDLFNKLSMFGCQKVFKVEEVICILFARTSIFLFGSNVSKESSVR